ncbi:zinc metallopeptidase [bacterium]|nr:zinc metallopeptidase [bacterium]
MFFDPLYMAVMGVGLVLSLWASAKTKGTFKKFSQFTTRRGLTGAEVAQAILRDNGISNVRVEPVAGTLTDHYDPRNRTLRLSESVYSSRSMAAAGVAAHEVGHAIQHAKAYGPLQFRSLWVPMASVSSGLSMLIITAAFLLGGAATVLGKTAGVIGVALFAATTVFTLITLPVEFDASRRALASLQRGGYMSSDELTGARRVLDAAALTYVAAAVTSVLTLLYFAFRLGLIGGRREE